MKVWSEVRSWVLILAAGVMIAGLMPRTWASAEASTWRADQKNGVEVGLYGFRETRGTQVKTAPLSELNNAGSGFALRGWAALIGGALAALVFALVGFGNRSLSLGWRAALAAPVFASFVATLLFASRLRGFGYLDLGWSVTGCMVSALIGGAALVISPSDSSSPES